MKVHKKFQVCYLMKTLATTPPTPCLVIMATQEVAQGRQTSATTPPAPTHLSTAEVPTHFNSELCLEQYLAGYFL